MTASPALLGGSETLFVGTYTDTSSRGIYSLRFDTDSGVLSKPTLAAAVPNPSFLAIPTGKNLLYATQEFRAGGQVNAFAVDPDSSRLRFINRQPTGGTITAHLAIDRPAKMVMAANYGSESICAFPIAPDGSLGPRTSFYKQSGPPGPNPLRQSKAHPHSITLSPDGAFAFVCDLGLDKVFIYRVDSAHATIIPNDPPTAAAPPGSGPRHSVFSPDGRFLYVIDEMGGSVCVFSWDRAHRSLALLQTISTLAARYRGFNGSAEIALGPAGKFLYASNRGPDTLSVFARNRIDGTLKLIEIVPSGGAYPRNFAISPDGHWLICANQKSDRIVVFQIDPGSGRLAPVGHPATVVHPTCIVFFGARTLLNRRSHG